MEIFKLFSGNVLCRNFAMVSAGSVLSQNEVDWLIMASICQDEWVRSHPGMASIRALKVGLFHQPERAVIDA
ncbi:hypothetical protein P12x_001985 [Tundrisphaera lichenicola]|uniref:hypothetical protein n=1 Tax=Tundrisphaera lichenicola TaxID=2029860 RepID=UPI003EBBB327